MEANVRESDGQDAPALSEPIVPSAAEEAITLELTEAEKTEEVLDPEILMMLGEDPSTQKEHGEDLHKDIAARWAHVLINGLPKESKLELMKQYLPAENCSCMNPPKLNLEIEAALTALNIKKDLFSQYKQNQISSCLAGIGKALNWALSASKHTLPQAQEIIKPLSDVGRLLCDIHYRESQSRRYAVINNLNKETREIVKNTKMDQYLFGTNLSEHLKSAKAISKSGLEMKTTQRAPYRPPTTQYPRGALNARGVPRAAAGPSRRNPAPRRPAAAPRDRRPDSYHQNRTSSARQRPRRR